MTPPAERPRPVFAWGTQDWARWLAWAAEVDRIRRAKWTDYGKDRIRLIALGRAAEAAWVRFLGGTEAMLPPAAGEDGGVDFRLWGRTFAVHYNDTPGGDLWFDGNHPLKAEVALLATATLRAGGSRRQGALELVGWAARGDFLLRAHPPTVWTPKGPGVLCLGQAEIADVRDRLP